MKFNLLVAITLLFLTGCASTGPSKQDVELAVNTFQLKPVSEGKARIYVYYKMRDKEPGDIALMANGSDEILGKVFYGEHTSFELPAGENTISWRGYSKSYKGVSVSSEKFVFEAGKTYVLNVVHATIFNRYADDGMSLISSLNLRKKQDVAIYYLSKTQESQINETCLASKAVIMFASVCL